MRLVSALTDDPYRPAVVTCLAEYNPPVARSKLATTFESRVSEVAVAASRPDIDLHHVHLPLPSSAGVVSYDVETNMVDLDIETPDELLR